MLSNQMLNGIPEVDLGIEAKIKNIEATEATLNGSKKLKRRGPSHFVPTNMAVKASILLLNCQNFNASSLCE